MSGERRNLPAPGPSRGGEEKDVYGEDNSPRIAIVEPFATRNNLSLSSKALFERPATGLKAANHPGSRGAGAHPPKCTGPLPLRWDFAGSNAWDGWPGTLGPGWGKFLQCRAVDVLFRLAEERLSVFSDGLTLGFDFLESTARRAAGSNCPTDCRETACSRSLNKKGEEACSVPSRSGPGRPNPTGTTN